MFEDFENRSGFWKGLGSNFTINHSGSTPSFISSGEMWQSMDGATTQTLAAWENGWVLTNNPDGTMTANPKYTSGLLSQTLVRVPVGPSSPNAVQPSTGGGVVVAYTAENKVFAYELDDLIPKNVIKTSHSCHGGNRGRMGYTIVYDDPTTELQGRGAPSLEDAIADSVSGERSDATWFIIHSYWEKDGALAIGKPMPPNQTGRFGMQKNKGANYCDEPEGHKDPNDPNGCASEHRAVNDDACGDCISGYSEDADGNCIADETEEAGTNWLLYGGIAAVAAFALLG
jgi:hypothetical protein